MYYNYILEKQMEKGIQNQTQYNKYKTTNQIWYIVETLNGTCWLLEIRLRY